MSHTGGDNAQNGRRQRSAFAGEKYAGHYFEVTEREDGTIIMTPMYVVPKSEAWLHTPEMRERLAQALQWMQEDPPAKTDLDEFLARIEEQRRSKDEP
jgi:hypothetical protein